MTAQALPALQNKPQRRTIAAVCVYVYGAVAFAALSAFGADRQHTIDASRALDAGAVPGAPADIVIGSIPPDPPPLVERSQWVFDLRWNRDEVWLLAVTPLELRAPRETPRVMGRFALELFEGPSLVERARFDFPLLAGADVGDGGRTTLSSSPSALAFSQNLRSRIGVVFPATSRGNRLELWDRATNRRWTLPWPPDPSAAARSGDSGSE